MRTTTTPDGHRFRMGPWLAVIAVPLLLVAGCTRPIEPNEAVLDPTGTTADEGGSTPATDGDADGGADDAPDTALDTTPTTEPDGTTADTAPATDADTDQDTDDDTDQDTDDDSTDPAVVTIGAIIGAGLLLGIAALWKVRMSRSDEDLPVSGSVPPDDAQ